MISGDKNGAVVIGASAGALDALSRLLPGLPADYALPVLLVVHLPRCSNNAFPSILKPKCSLDLREAEDKEPASPGTVYMAPPDYHLLVEPNGLLSLSNEEEEMFARPSIDVLFETAANAFADKAIGIILSGANNDGARGIKAIHDAGGMTIVQDPGTASSPMMPEAALKSCPDAFILKPEDIAIYLKKIGGK